MAKKLFSKSRVLKKANCLGKEAGEKELNEVDKKLPFMQRGPVKKIWDKVTFLWDAYKKADIPKSLKITIIGALLYLILPADILPDVIPGIGLLDDCTVILLVFNEVSKYLVPKVVKKAKTKMEESYYKKIDSKLNEVFLMMLLNSAITFFINMAGIIVLILKPAGEKSYYIAIAVFSLTLIYTLIRIILYFKNYGKVTLGITKLVIKEKSLSRGVSIYVEQTYPLITTIYAGINIVQNFVPGLDAIPDLDMIVKDFINHFKKKVVLVLVLFTLYSAAIFIVKLLLTGMK